MSLGTQQREFALAFAKLIIWIYKQGYEVSYGDAYRDPRVHGEYNERRGYGHPRSFHKKRLAKDINLFKDGEYLRSTEAHRPIGEKWEKMGGTWGGRFSEPDGNHYSWGEDR
jgi:hypothetical protein